MSDFPMPRYVVLYHETADPQERPSHWDFMLEEGGVLRTWAIYTAPTLDAAHTMEALPDHRLEYLEYEGPLSGERGEVTRVCSGSYEKLFEDWPRRLVVRLCDGEGELILHLERMKATQFWTARFEVESTAR